MKIIIFMILLILASTKLVDKTIDQPLIALTPYNSDNSKTPTFTLTVTGVSRNKKEPKLVYDTKISTPYIAVYKFVVEQDDNDYKQDYKVNATIKVPLTSKLKQIVIITHKEWVVVTVPTIQTPGSVVDLVKEFGPLDEK